jgi:hypothetical protein
MKAETSKTNKLRFILKLSFAVIFLITLFLTLTPASLLFWSMVYYPALVAEAEVFFCLRYFLLDSFRKTKCRTVFNGICLAVSSLVIVENIVETIVHAVLGECLFGNRTSLILIVWMGIHILMRTLYWVIVDMIDKKHAAR